MASKSPYGNSSTPKKLKDLQSFLSEIAERRRVLVPAKSHMNMTAKALQKIEEGEDLRAVMVEKYLTLIGHSATVALRRGKESLGEIPLGKISEAAVLAVKADAISNREVAESVGKCQGYFSMPETSPSLELSLEIFEALGYNLRFRLYSHGITETMEKNIELKREKIGLVSSRSAAPSSRQREAKEALSALFA